MTTKAERIRQLLTAGVCNSMIADIVGCREEYVRVVKQRLDPRRQEMDRAAARAMYASGDRGVMRRASRIIYREAIKAGRSRKEASRLAWQAAVYAAVETHDGEARRAAYHAAKRGTSHA